MEAYAAALCGIRMAMAKGMRRQQSYYRFRENGNNCVSMPAPGRCILAQIAPIAIGK